MMMQATSSRGAVASYTSDDEDGGNRQGVVAEGAASVAAGRSHSSGLGRLRSNKN